MPRQRAASTPLHGLGLINSTPVPIHAYSQPTHQSSPPELKSCWSDYSFIAPSITESSASTASTVVSMRSSSGMHGLAGAESGAAMVELDPGATGSGFKTGTSIALGLGTPSPGARGRQRSATVSGTGASLQRNATLFTNGNPSELELKTLLGARSGRKVSAKLRPRSRSASRSRDLKLKDEEDEEVEVSLEKGKSRSKARVEVDIELESDVVVEGGYLRGKIIVDVRKAKKDESPVWIGGGKLRVVGFEGLPNSDTRYTFYQHAEPLSHITSASHTLYASAADEEGFARAREGTHILPFAMKVPENGGNGGGKAKGVLLQLVRYIAMGSIKIRDPPSSSSPSKPNVGSGNGISIAHFYRSIDLFPFLPQSALHALPQPLRTTTAQSLFMGGGSERKLHLAAQLHRKTFVAGQRLFVHVSLRNSTTRKVGKLSFNLVRTTTMFLPKDNSGDEGGEGVETSTAKKEVASSILEEGKRGEKGVVTAKGFWMGVDEGEEVELSHFILIPPDALSIPRGKLVEVDYALKVSASTGSLASDVVVSLPVRVINFLSIDPPPTFPLPNTKTNSAIKATTIKPQTPQKELQRGKSTSMQNLREHEGFLKDWEKERGKPMAFPSPISPSTSGLPPRSTSVSPTRKTAQPEQQTRRPTPTKSTTMPPPGLPYPSQQRAMTPTGLGPIPRSMTMPGPPPRSPGAQHMVGRYPPPVGGPQSPTRNPNSGTISVSQSNGSFPNHHAQTMPRQQPRQPPPSIPRSSSTLPRPCLSSSTSSPERGRIAAREIFASKSQKSVAFADDDDEVEERLPPLAFVPPPSPVKEVARSISPRKQRKALPNVSPAPPTPAEMKLTASTAADDELSSTSSSSEDEVIKPLQKAVPESSPIPRPRRDVTPLMQERAGEGDMSRDAQWEGGEADSSLELMDGDAEDGEYLLQTEIPQLPLDESMTENRFSPVHQQSEHYRHPTYPHNNVTLPAKSRTRHTRPATSDGCTLAQRPVNVLPRATSVVQQVNRMIPMTKPNPTRSHSSMDVQFPQPPPTRTSIEEPRWSGVLTSASVSKVSVAKIIPPSQGGPRHPALRPTHRKGSSSVSSASSSGQVPIAVKSKIAQLEARNRALRAFSGSPSMVKSLSHNVVLGALGGDRSSVSSAESIYSGGGVGMGGFGVEEYEAFKSPMFRRTMMKQQQEGKWVTELKRR